LWQIISASENPGGIDVARELCQKVTPETRLCRLMCGSALRFRCGPYEFGAPPNKLGTAQNSRGGFAGRPKAFRTSGGEAEDFLGKAWHGRPAREVTCKMHVPLALSQENRAHER